MSTQNLLPMKNSLALLCLSILFIDFTFAQVSAPPPGSGLYNKELFNEMMENYHFLMTSEGHTVEFINEYLTEMRSLIDFNDPVILEKMLKHFTAGNGGYLEG